MKKAMIRLRMSEHDAHYGGGLVNGARMLDLFGDVATELLIMSDGDEGLFKVENAEFTAPVFAGDFIEVIAWFTKIGNTSREMKMEAWKVIQPIKDAKKPSACEILAQPILVAQAHGICVVPKENQRGPQVPIPELFD